METIGNLWYIWLIGMIGSLFYLLYTSWEYFSIIIKGDDLENDPENKAVRNVTLRAFWPSVSAGLFLVLLVLASFYNWVIS
jgi:hypothetical protein